MSLRRRLSVVAMAIDAGRYSTPGAAADEILAVLASAHTAHREELLDWVKGLPPLEGDPEPEIHPGHRNDCPICARDPWA